MKFIRYIWLCKQGRIEMAGMFTPERWKQFRRQPHPLRDDVTIIPL